MHSFVSSKNHFDTPRVCDSKSTCYILCASCSSLTFLHRSVSVALPCSAVLTSPESIQQFMGTFICNTETIFYMHFISSKATRWHQQEQVLIFLFDLLLPLLFQKKVTLTHIFNIENANC